MLASLIRRALRHPRLVAAAAFLFLVYGLALLPSEKLDVLPDVSPAHASAETEAPGMVAEQVEQLVTRPMENALIGAPGVARVHSSSIQGLSVVTLQFQPGVDPDRARQAIAERLSEAESQLPKGAGPPRLSPPTAGDGDILKIGFSSDKLTPMALRTLVQWTVRPRLLSVPGVAQVQVFGGQVRRIEVRARAGDLSDSDLGYPDVFAAVQRATGVTGAGFIDTPSQRVLIDPRGQALTTDDIAAGQIQVVGSAPTRISDVADVVEAPAPAIGDASIGGRPAVVVSVARQYGANTLETTRAVEAALAVLGPSLVQQGVKVTSDLDRPASFVDASVRSLVWSLAIGALLAMLLLILLLRDWRSALVSLVTIPLSLCAALVALKLLGWTLNSMTLGGLAVALGLIVDDAAIDIENILARLRDAEARHASRTQAVLTASLAVRAPVLYATALVAVGLLPLVFMPGPTGALLRPLAVSAIVASLASLVVAVAVTPALALLFLNHVRPSHEPHVVHRLKVGYDALLARAMAPPAWAIHGLIGLVTLIAVLGLVSFKPELLPTFHSGHLTAEITAPASTSLDVMRDYGGRIGADLAAIPQVARVSQETGRAETGEDAAGPERARFDIELKPRLSAGAQDAVQRKVAAAIEAYPGFHAEVRPRLTATSQDPAERGQVQVRVFGNDLDAIDAAAGQVATSLAATPGGVRVTRRNAGDAAPAVRIDLNFQRLAIYGLSAADVLDTVQTAFQGRQAAQIYEDGRAIDVAVTAQASIRQDPEGVGDLLLRSSSGISVPLKSVANIYLDESRGLIEHDNGVRRRLLLADPTGDPRAFAKVARQRLAALTLPAGVYVEVVPPVGADNGRLLLDVALAGFAMLALLLLAFGSVRASALVLGSTAFAFVGGVVAVALMGGVLSLGALVGFVTLFGLSTRNAILLVSRVEDLVIQRARPWSAETARLAARQRLWPILTASLLVAAAVAPLAVQAGAPGEEILGPMAVVILGGLLTSAVMSLFLSPRLALEMWRPKQPSSDLPA